METEYYRSPNYLLPTFSLVLATSLVGLNQHSAAIQQRAEVISGKAIPASAHHSYYAVAKNVSEPEEQIEALKNFASSLLAVTEDNPQEVVNVLNKHFWELV